MGKIVFINPPNNIKKENNFSNGLFSLASILKRQGYYVRIIDFDYLFSNKIIRSSKVESIRLEIMSQYILDENPDIVDFYTMSNSYYQTIKLSKIIKEKRKEIKVLFGGPQATLSFEETLKNFPWIDGIGMGEGEKTITPIINALLKNKELTDEKGVAYLKNGLVIKNGIELIENLDELQDYDYSLLEGNIKEKISLDVGRGCPFGCKYCSTKTFWKRNFRLKSSERIIREITYIKNNFNVDYFNFEHDLFTANRSKVIDFCNKIIKSNLNIKWTCSSRVDTLDEEMIDIMYKAGCRGMFLGIETGSPRMQKIINKNLRLNEVKNIANKLKKNGIMVVTSFIYGFPEETEDDLEKTLNLIYDLIKIDIDIIQLHLFAVFPGTDYMNELKDYLYLSNNFSDAAFTDHISNEEKKIIECNKEIFSQYMDFNIGIRRDFKYLDIYAHKLLKKIIKYFNKTYDILMSKVGGHVEIFKAFREVNRELLVRYENWNENIFISYDEIISSINNLINFINLNDDSLLKEIFKFESDIVKFMYYSSDKYNVKSYKYDVYSIKSSKINSLHKCNYLEQISIKYTRLNDKYDINIKKIG